jgi:Lipocalin-like domain
MKPSNFLIKTIPFLVFLFSCNMHRENNKLIIGHWAGAEWLVNGKQSDLNAQNTYFTFNDKEEYTYEYSGNIEKGTYKVEKDMLFTTPTGEQEIMVKIIKLTKDSLVFDMNRGGQPESLTLLRK